ncbi:hypothetical protein, partial [Plasmodium yoelii yoelii]
KQVYNFRTLQISKCQ